MRKNEVFIRPYIDPRTTKNGTGLGTEQYGHVFFEGVSQVDTLAYVEEYGVKRWLNGLNEEAPEIAQLPEIERSAKRKAIREAVAKIEKRLGNNTIDVNDEQFWNKVKVANQQNHEFWNKVSLRVENNPIKLNPEDVQDYIRILAIEAGGFKMIAPSLDALLEMNRPPNFYLDKVEQTAATNTEVRKLRNKAGAELDKMFTKDTTRMFYTIVLIAPDPTKYNKHTPLDILYEDAGKYIDGEFSERDKRKTAEKFLFVAKMNMEDLTIRAVVEAARKTNLIAAKADGQIYIIDSGIPVGKNLEEAYQYFKSPVNQKEWDALFAQVSKVWNTQ